MSHSGALRSVRLRTRPDGLVWFRNDTTDYPTMVSCFVDGFHLPAMALGANPVILDLGVNAGYTIVDFKRRYPDARIVGVEMDLGNFEIARRNITGLTNVELINAAVWVSDGEVTYDTTAQLDAFSVSAQASNPYTSARVMAIGLPSLLKRYGVARASFIKMDIEGGEKDIFMAPNLCWLNQVDQISIELHGTIEPEIVKQRLVDFGMEVADSDKHWSTVRGWRNTNPKTA